MRQRLFGGLAFGLLFFLHFFGGFLFGGGLLPLRVFALPLPLKQVVYHLLALFVLLAKGRGYFVSVYAYVVGRVAGLNDYACRGGVSLVAFLFKLNRLVQELVGLSVVGIGNQKAVKQIHRLVVLALVQVLLRQRQSVLPYNAAFCPGRRRAFCDSPDSKEKKKQKQNGRGRDDRNLFLF